MESRIKVTPEVITNTAQELSTQAGNLNSLTGQMMNEITALTGVWAGEAAETYLTKFRTLEEDMQKMYLMIREHSADLQEMASAYSTAETENTEEAQGLAVNVIV